MGVQINAATPLVFADAHPSRNFLRAFVLQPRNKQESPPSYQSTTKPSTIANRLTCANPPHHHHSATTKTTSLFDSHYTQPKWRTTAAPPAPPRKSPACGEPGGLFTRWFRTGYAILGYRAHSTRHPLTCMCLDYRVTSWPKTKSRSRSSVSSLNTQTRMEHQSEFLRHPSPLRPPPPPLYASHPIPTTITSPTVTNMTTSK